MTILAMIFVFGIEVYIDRNNLRSVLPSTINARYVVN
jgi:hypothetical protein